MLQSIILYLATTAIGAILGVVVNSAKGFNKKLKEREESEIKNIEILKRATLSQIKSSLTNTFYAYNEIAKSKGVPEYIQQNWIEEYDNYKALGGNHYMENLYEIVKTWKTYKTI